MHLIRCWVVTTVLCFCAPAYAESPVPQAHLEDYCQWKVTDYGIAESLCGLGGDAQRGRRIVSDSGGGNCIACHVLPLEHIAVFGTIGPPLTGVAARYTESQLRLRVTDIRQINPNSIMPGFYRQPSLINRPARAYIGRTFLTAQQVEDVIAYLKTLK